MPHTPGPFVVEDVTSVHLHDICLGYTVPEAGNPVLIGTAYWDDEGGPITLEQAGANARLWAASPDAHELLDALADWFEGGAPLSPSALYDDTRTWKQAVQEYMAKVKGS